MESGDGYATYDRLAQELVTKAISPGQGLWLRTIKSAVASFIVRALRNDIELNGADRYAARTEAQL
jgi:hypothetical protein